METFRIEHKTTLVLRRVISVIMFINGLFWVLGHLDDLKFYHWLFGVLFILIGIAYYTDGFGTEQSYIEEDGNILKIKWLNRFRPFHVQTTEIERITLTRYKVVIDRSGKKPITLSIDFFEREQKKEVYEYFIEYARIKNLELIRDF